MTARLKFTPAMRKHYLELFEKCGLVTHCARAVGITSETVRKHREKDPEFNEACDRAYGVMQERIEREILRRGVEGVLEPVFYQGMIVGHKLMYSDRMLELHAKRHMPEYREKSTVDMNVTGGVLVVPQLPESEREWEDRHRNGRNGRGAAVPSARR